MASEKPDCRSEQRGCPRRRGDRKSGLLHVSCGSFSTDLAGVFGRVMSASARKRRTGAELGTLRFAGRP